MATKKKRSNKQGRKSAGRKPEVTDEQIEQMLINAKYLHVPESELIKYRDGTASETGKLMTDAHLKLCLICERRLQFLKEELAAVQDYEITDEDRAAIRKFVKSQRSNKK